MEEFQLLRVFNKLKSVYRFNSVDERKESSAEHSWGCLILADYFMSTASYGVDRIKVYEILMYHDVVEIESGDVSLLDQAKYADKREQEKHSAMVLQGQMPFPLNDQFLSRWEEFERGTSKEAMFARAIDALEAEIHELDYKKDWAGWTKEYLLSAKLHRFENFPEMKEMFEKIVVYLEENDYFDKTAQA